MIKSEKRLKDLESKLNSGNEKVISEAISQLRNEPSFNGAIQLLTGLFDTTSNLIIRNIIQLFLIDLKEPGVRIEVISELRKPYSQETKCMLVSSCWQSGLDYSEYSSDFASIFMDGDYYTALECFTILEETAKNIPDNERKEIIKLLENSEKKFITDKRALNRALIELLK